MNNNCRTEEFRVNGDDIVRKVKEIIEAGNARRITIKNEKGDTMMEIPLTVAIVGAVLAPILAAIGAMAALVTHCTIVVEKKEPTI